MNTIALITCIVLSPISVPARGRVESGEIDLSQSQVDHLLKQSPCPIEIKADEEQAPDDEANTNDHTAIIEAINDLDQDDEDLWTKDGKPKTEALSELLGVDVSAEDRDQAWETVQASE